MGKIPYHFIFAPRDHGLINSFLNPKLRGEALSYDDVVFEMERHYIYGGKTPWDIFYTTIREENENANAVYLFTTPPPPNENNTSKLRGLIRTFVAYFQQLYSYMYIVRGSASINVGGVWKVEGDGSSLPIKDPDNGNQVIGFKKRFIYVKNDENYSNFDQDGVQWLLTEYTSLQPSTKQSLDLVVCKIEKIEEEEDWDNFSEEDGSSEGYEMRPICD